MKGSAREEGGVSVRVVAKVMSLLRRHQSPHENMHSRSQLHRTSSDDDDIMLHGMFSFGRA
jgi:hypothetical protein